MAEIKIVKATTKEDCIICDEFLSKLIKYESSFDNIINQNVAVSGPAENNIKQNDVYLAYAQADVPVGYILGYRQFAKGKIYNKDIFVVEALYVEENHRKAGIGKMLLKSFENWVKENYSDFIIEITHLSSNESAKKFYEKMGYSTSKTTLRK